jgi:hypothetical protein
MVPMCLFGPIVVTVMLAAPPREHLQLESFDEVGTARTWGDSFRSSASTTIGGDLRDAMTAAALRPTPLDWILRWYEAQAKASRR